MWYSEIENNALQSSNKSTLLSYQTDCFLTSKRLREKCQNTDFFLVRIFPYSDWIRRDAPYLFVFNQNAGKYKPEKTLYFDTSHALNLSLPSLEYDSSDSDYFVGMEMWRANVSQFFQIWWFFVVGSKAILNH